MTKNRMEAFSDGVIAILITIMVLELKVPPGHDWASLQSMTPVFLAYVLSFLFLGIYWNNHHHLLHAAHRVNAAIMWANLHLLFWLSLTPFVTAWMGEAHLAPIPTAAYGAVLLASGMAYSLLQVCILREEGPDSALARAIGRDSKGKLSLVLYLIAIAAAFVRPWISAGIYVLVAFLWLVPDRRIEKSLGR